MSPVGINGRLLPLEDRAQASSGGKMTIHTVDRCFFCSVVVMTAVLFSIQLVLCIWLCNRRLAGIGPAADTE